MENNFIILESVTIVILHDKFQMKKSQSLFYGTQTRTGTDLEHRLWFQTNQGLSSNYH